MNNKKYNDKSWNFDLTAKRIISWLSNHHLTYDESDQNFKNSFNTIIKKQANHLINEINKSKIIDDKLIDDKLLEDTQKNKKDKVCGYKQFKDKLDKLSEESSESVYSYVSIDEPKSEKFSYFYIICFVIGLFLIYLLYNGNIFITLIEFVLNFSFPYIYIPIKLYINKKEILYKIKNN